ncbi:MAG TPA: M23 family peptidase, partial [Mariprofundaceae bacterium]|nr:M23 family peptidase [Mariprofundaceae bacterium]
MQQDFASRVGQESVRPSVSKRRPSSKQLLSVKPVMLGAAGTVAALFMLTLLLVGNPVDASVPTTKEEWLKVKPLQDLEEKSLTRIVLQPGDAAVSALGKLGFPFAEVMEMSRASKPVFSLRQVRAGQAFSRADQNSQIHVYYEVDNKQRLHLFASEESGWQAEITPRPVHTRQVRTSGVIEGSLFSAAVEAGMDERTTMNLIDIFSWDVDFARDLRSGDSFSVLYEEQFDDRGKLIGTVIKAAEFKNQGETYRAIRYTLANGDSEYFSPDGSSMRKTYLKSPVKFSR